MANRIYFANQQVAFRRDGATTWYAAHGVQSVAVTTTFNLEQAFELGQLAIYENIEGVPDIEMTMSKVLDGYALLYHLVTNEAAGHGHGPTLAGRSNAKVVAALGVWPDTQDSASGNPSQQMEASGMFCSAISYNFPLEDNFSEDVTMVSHMPWITRAGHERLHDHMDFILLSYQFNYQIVTNLLADGTLSYTLGSFIITNEDTVGEHAISEKKQEFLAKL